MEASGLITLVVVLAIVGVALWAINTFIPMDQRIKTLINVVVVIAAVLYVLSALLGFGGLKLR